MKDILSKIKPKMRGKSDKYSWCLYSWIKNNNFDDMRVWFDCKSPWDGSQIQFDKNNILINQIWIGTTDDEWLLGSRLSSILGGKYKRWANPWMGKTHIDITDWFWKEYIKDGRCIWDRNHDKWLDGDENRYSYVNKNSRKCKWCGQWQYREIEKKVEVKRNEVWKLTIL